MKRVVVGVLVIGLLAGCASSGSDTKASPAAPKSTTAAPKTTAAPVDPNVATCDDVHNYILSKVQPTFKSWDVAANEFDQRVGNELRQEATHLFSFQGRARGAAASAIGREATGLTNISIAIEEQDDSLIGDAANKANSALAALRGTCGF